jgi:diacylglycerol kinase family enzyme
MAAGGNIGRQWPQINRRLRSGGLLFDWEYTTGAGQAKELARAAVDNGYGYIIAVGGDGTVNEIANGILGSTTIGNTMLGLLSAGTSSDFAHCLGIPEDHASACSLLLSGRKIVIDVGFVEYSSGDQSQGRYFLWILGKTYPPAPASLSPTPCAWSPAWAHCCATITGWSP